MGIEIITIGISIISCCIALVAAWISTRTLEEHKRISKIQNNYALLAQANNLLVQHPGLLELHNISLEELKTIGVTEQEVVYLLQSIIAAETYYEIEKSKHVDYKNFSDYRRNLLSNPKVKLIWTTFMRDKLVFTSPFVIAVDEYYKAQLRAEVH